MNTPKAQNWRGAWAPQEGSAMTWVVQESGTAFVVAVHDEHGQTVKVHPIPFAREVEAKRAAARLNERDAKREPERPAATFSFPEATRITVVTQDGLVFERYDAYPNGVELYLQDDGRTLKLLPIVQGE